LILKKIIKIVATICQILRLKCTKFDFDWGCSRPRWRSLQRSPRSPSWISGLLLRAGGGGEGKGKGWKWGREEEGKGRKGA